MKFYITPEGRYVVDPGDGYSRVRLATADRHELSELTTFDECPALMHVSDTRYVTHYEDVDGNRMPAEQYEREKQARLAAMVPSPTDPDELIWPDLEQEFAHRRICERWQAVVVERLQHTPFEPDWVRHREPTTGLILTSYYQGDPAKAEAWFYERHVVMQTIRAVLRDARFTEVDSRPHEPATFKLYDFDDRVSIYLPGGGYDRHYHTRMRTRGTLEDMEQRVAAIIADVTDAIFARLYADIKPGCFTDVLARACAVRSRLENVESKRKTYDDLSAGRKELDALIRELEKIGAEAAGGAVESSLQGGDADGRGAEDSDIADKADSAEGHGQQPGPEDGAGNPEGAATHTRRRATVPTEELPVIATWWRLNAFGDLPEKLDVVRETPHTVQALSYYGWGSRARRVYKKDCRPTLDEALVAAIDAQRVRVVKAQDWLDDTQATLDVLTQALGETRRAAEQPAASGPHPIPK